LKQFATNETVTDQITAMASTPILSQGQGTTSSITEPEGHTVSSEHRLAQQPGGHVLEGSESITDSFVSAQENTEPDGTHHFLNGKVAQLEISLRETTLERDNSRGLEDEITLERDNSRRLENEIALKHDMLRGSENSTREIALDYDKLRGELDVSRRQLEAAYRNGATLERQMQDFHLKSSEGAKDLKRKVTVLTAKVRDHESGRDYTQAYQEGVWAGMHSQSYTDDLLKQVEAYKALAAKWRNEAYGKGSEAVSRCWQASVDEAVRLEREKDAFVMKVLQDELTALKSKKEG
jgi:hypothetical protein